MRASRALTVLAVLLASPASCVALDWNFEEGQGLPDVDADAVVDATFETGDEHDPDTGSDGTTPALDAEVEASDDATVDATVDATLLDAGLDSGTTVPPGFPIHVPAIDAGTVADLVDPTTIDTDARIVTGSAGVLPATFVHANGAAPDPSPYAILVVNDLVVTKALRVRGTYPLIIVARGNVTIAQTVSAGAMLVEPGPGGGWTNAALPAFGLDGGLPDAGTRLGMGGPGGIAGGRRSGAGGAGHKGGGARGQSNGGDGGAAYGGATPALLGGSPGGAGTNPSLAGACGYGGAGGGAIQISAFGRITVTGALDVGGGGGQGGCGDNSGGGAGSAGTLLLEALLGVRIDGVLAANGGGAGGGATSGGGGLRGVNGSNGGVNASAAPGGAGGGASTDRAGGAGGARDAGPMTSAGTPNRGGGGGGSVGRILVRYRQDGGLGVGDASVVSPDLVALPLD